MQSLFILRFGFFHPSQLHKAQAEIEVCAGVMGIDFESFLELNGSFIRQAFLYQRCPQTDAGGQKVRSQLHCFLEMEDGFIQVSLHDQTFAQVEL